MDLGTIRQINIDNEMQASYLDYAMSVIVARALPDVRDGLKPVHRRILYAMHDLGLDPDKPYKKSARIVGEVLGKYHPHGDAAVYEAMVRMAQDFSLRYPLVDGQGNFGSIDGDNAAAMRYTEARLAPISEEMLNDIDKDTVDWTDNFDGTLKEPSVLPAALPNLVVNGSSGIAVGMSTNIPPHNLGEVCNALCFLIDNYQRAEEVPIEDLMRFIPGPDFPTGGLIYRYQHENGADGEEHADVIARAYASGKGRIVVQAKAHIEDMSRNRSRIVVTELPYQTNKTNLLERIAELVRDGRLEGVTDLRDESDRTGMRICIEMTRTVEPREVLSELYKLTPLQSTFSISLLALLDGEPHLLSLKRLLLHFLEHRQAVIRRRSEHDLKKALLRKEILEGLLRALDILDEVIALIRKSRTADTARRNLIEQFKFTEIQTQAILDMQLRRLAALERQKLKEEYDETLRLIKELEALLASPEKVLALIRKNLIELKTKYDNPRRTQIADRVKGALTTMDVLPDQEVWLSLGADGILARRLTEGMDAAGARKLAAEAALALITTNTRNDLYLFSARGQATRIPIHQIPEMSGAHYADLSGLTRRDRVVAIVAASKPQADLQHEGFLALGTVQGKVKRISLPDLGEQAHTNPQVINLDAGDELAWVNTCASGGEIMLLTAEGQVIRFQEDDVRVMGLPAGGVAGIRLQVKDRVVAGLCVPDGAGRDTMLALMTARGWGKQTPLSEFPVQGRGGQGVLAGKVSERSGRFAGFSLLVSGDALLVRVEGGNARLLAANLAPSGSRSSQGKPLFVPGSGEQLRGLQAVAGLPLATTSPAKRSRGEEPPPGKPSGAGRSVAKRATAATAVQPSLLPAEEPPSASKGRAAKTEKPAPKAAASSAPAAGAAPPATRTRAAKPASAVASQDAKQPPAAPVPIVKAAAKKPPVARAGSPGTGPSSQPPPREAEPPVSSSKGAAKKAPDAPAAASPKFAAKPPPVEPSKPAAPKAAPTSKAAPAAPPKGATKKATAPAPTVAPPKSASKSSPAEPAKPVAPPEGTAKKPPVPAAPVTPPKSATKSQPVQPPESPAPRAKKKPANPANK